MYIKQCLFKGSPNCKLTHCRNCCWNWFSVGTRLYWTDPSEVAFSDSKWEKGGRKGGNKWEKGGRKGGNKGKKRQYLDKLTKQIFRHPPLFLNITYYWKFLSSHTHTRTRTRTLLPAEMWRSWLPQVLLKSLVCFAWASAHWKCLILRSLKLQNWWCRPNRYMQDFTGRWDPCRSGCQVWVNISAFLQGQAYTIGPEW